MPTKVSESSMGPCMMQHVLDHNNVVGLHGAVVCCPEAWHAQRYRHCCGLVMATQFKNAGSLGVKILCEGPCDNMHAAVGMGCF
jgi:hypothetical protein